MTELRPDPAAFAANLAHAMGERDVYQLIVDTMAGALRANIASLAVYDAREERLGIRATYGYPISLVEHLRFHVGSEVIGRTFESRRPRVVTDIGRESGAHRPRLRYRTRSFVAMPLLAGGDAVGVLCLADRSDGQPFDTQDLSEAEALIAPASLALGRVGLVKEKRRLEHELARDPLTGLFNRRYFEARVEEEIGRARRQTSEVSLLAIDIDHFKSLNDEAGHSAGDAVLRGVGRLLRRSVRIFDVCARQGGDEFVVLLPDSDGASALHSAERIRRRIESYEPEAPRLGRATITVSIGLAVTAAPGGTAQDLMARADRALYRAKDDGRNCVRVDPS